MMMRRTARSLLIASLLLHLVVTRGKELSSNSFAKTARRVTWSGFVGKLRGARSPAPSAANRVGNSDSIPSVFGPNESQYNQFAACLATTGLSVTDFYNMGKILSQNPKLKDKVMEQAFLYRVAAKHDKGTELVTPKRAVLAQVPKKQLPRKALPRKSERSKRISAFSNSIAEIEQLRESQMEKLQRALNVDKLPRSMKISDPSVTPFLSPKVRAVVEAFPLQAEEIVKKHGLNSKEFNQMMQDTRTNPIFRYTVQSKMKKRNPKNQQTRT